METKFFKLPSHGTKMHPLTFSSEEHASDFSFLLSNSEKGTKGDPYRIALLFCLARHHQVAMNAERFYNFSYDELHDQEKIEKEMAAGWMTSGYNLWIRFGLNLYNDYHPMDVSEIFGRALGEWPLVLSALGLRFDRSADVF